MPFLDVADLGRCFFGGESDRSSRAPVAVIFGVGKGGGPFGDTVLCCPAVVNFAKPDGGRLWRSKAPSVCLVVMSIRHREAFVGRICSFYFRREIRREISTEIYDHRKKNKKNKKKYIYRAVEAAVSFQDGKRRRGPVDEITNPVILFFCFKIRPGGMKKIPSAGVLTY